ncbi:hypothetical protein KY331_06495 [Candidatus Woesearchaeota archaeon]|nr:hypothetical protein [Candidatus Woesearchaeota archaeon]
MVNKSKKGMFAVLIIFLLLFNIGFAFAENGEAGEEARKAVVGFGKALRIWFVSVKDADTGVPFYDNNKLLIDFMIFFVIFLSISTLSLTKVFAKGGKNAALGLSIALAAALALAAIKAGMSVTFFIPFVKNILIFLLFIVIFLLFRALGIKSNFWNFILSIIVTLLLFNIGNIIIDKDVQMNFRNLFGVPTAKPIDVAEAEAAAADKKIAEAEQDAAAGRPVDVEKLEKENADLRERLAGSEEKHGLDAIETSILRKKIDELSKKIEEAAPEEEPPKPPTPTPTPTPEEEDKGTSGWWALILIPILLGASLASKKVRKGIGRAGRGIGRAIKNRKKRRAKRFFATLDKTIAVKDTVIAEKNKYKNQIVARTGGIKEEKVYLDEVLASLKKIFPKVPDIREWLIQELKNGEDGFLSESNLKTYENLPGEIKERISKLKESKERLERGMPIETAVHFVLAGETVFKRLAHIISYLIHTQRIFKTNFLFVMKLKKEELAFLKERIEDVEKHIEDFEKAEKHEKPEKHNAMLQHLTHPDIEGKIIAALREEEVKEKELKDFYSRLVNIYRESYTPLIKVVNEFIAIMKFELEIINHIIQGKTKITKEGKTTANLIELMQTKIKEQNDKWEEEKGLIKKLKASWPFQDHVMHVLEEERKIEEKEKEAKAAPKIPSLFAKEAGALSKPVKVPKEGDMITVWAYSHEEQKPEIWKVGEYRGKDNENIIIMSDKGRGRPLGINVNELLSLMRAAKDIPPLLEKEKKANKETRSEKAIEMYTEIIKGFEEILAREIAEYGQEWLQKKIKEVTKKLESKGGSYIARKEEEGREVTMPTPPGALKGGELVTIWRYTAQKPEIWKVGEHVGEKVMIRSDEGRGEPFRMRENELLNRIRDAKEIPPLLEKEKEADKAKLEKAIEIYEEVKTGFEEILAREIIKSGRRWLKEKIKEVKRKLEGRQLLKSHISKGGVGKKEMRRRILEMVKEAAEEPDTANAIMIYEEAIKELTEFLEKYPAVDKWWTEKRINKYKRAAAELYEKQAKEFEASADKEETLEENKKKLIDNAEDCRKRAAELMEGTKPEEGPGLVATKKRS